MRSWLTQRLVLPMSYRGQCVPEFFPPGACGLSIYILSLWYINFLFFSGLNPRHLSRETFLQPKYLFFPQVKQTKLTVQHPEAFFSNRLRKNINFGFRTPLTLLSKNFFFEKFFPISIWGETFSDLRLHF